MVTRKYYYSTYNDAEFPFEFDYEGPDDLRWAAENMAKEFFHEHDGWECSWPLDFYIWDKDMVYLGCVSVEIEYDPVFYAGKVDRK